MRLAFGSSHGDRFCGDDERPLLSRAPFEPCSPGKSTRFFSTHGGEFFPYGSEQTESGQPVLDENGQPKVAHFGILRTHFLFNIQQTEGLEAFNATLIETEPSDPFQANSAAENLLLSSGAKIVHRPADQAFYHPLRDFIQLPTKAQFHNESGYYATALHELSHNAASRIMPHVADKARWAA